MGLDRVTAVLLDALGTLVALPDPAGALAEELAVRGAAVTPWEAADAMRAEIGFYRAHLHEAVDPERLDDLRDRCTAVLRDALPARARGVDDLRGALLGALRFTAFPEVPEVLARLRAAGHRLVVASNWDVSLHDVLDRTGIAPLVDGAVSSAEVGAAKPDPRLFAAALAVAGARADEAIHVGDSLDADVEGARAAGIAAVLVWRDDGPPPPGVPSIRSLRDLRVP